MSFSLKRGDLLERRTYLREGFNGGLTLFTNILLPFSSRELHIVNSHLSFQAPHGVLHHPGVYTMCIFGHAQLDRVLDETR